MKAEKNRQPLARHSGIGVAFALAAALLPWAAAGGPGSSSAAAQSQRRERRKAIVNGKEIREGKVVVNDDSEKPRPGGREVTASWVDDLRRGELKAKNIELTGDGADVKAVAADGYFKLTEAQAGISRQLEIERGEDGRLVRSYFVDGERREFDADARDWLSRTLRDYFRRPAGARPK